MENEYVMQVANTIREQLVGKTPFNTIMSWGIGKFVDTAYKDMPALMFSVNGRLHKENIIIALNGADYYEVYLQNDKGTTLINEDVCFDELGDVIDEYIESGTNKEEYNRFCKQQLSDWLTA